ncbi:MAG: DUF4416 family protein [Deltaproteobacteria bacterium]|nr:DUF4416 family protein [Deltaproteobacteria bacterium]
MSVPQDPDPAQLVISLLSAQENPLDTLSENLETLFGPVENVFGPLRFDFTTYYDIELGVGIKRWIVTAQKLVDPASLAEIKLSTNGIERKFATAEGRRRFNLDPGLMTLGNFVLATGKNNAHRIYLRDGIFADLTLIFRRASYRSLEWTYPDYSDSILINILNQIREMYKQKLEKQS